MQIKAIFEINNTKLKIQKLEAVWAEFDVFFLSVYFFKQ
jgi:hypothetical protein